MEKYKKAIKDILNKNLKDKENFIREMLKNDCNAKKITEDQYKELSEFLEQKIKEIEQQEKQVETDSKEEIVKSQPTISKQFKEQYRVKENEDGNIQRKKEIKFTPIHRGEWLKPKLNGEDGANQKGER